MDYKTCFLIFLSLYCLMGSTLVTLPVLAIHLLLSSVYGTFLLIFFVISGIGAYLEYRYGFNSWDFFKSRLTHTVDAQKFPAGIFVEGWWNGMKRVVLAGQSYKLWEEKRVFVKLPTSAIQDIVLKTPDDKVDLIYATQIGSWGGQLYGAAEVRFHYTLGDWVALLNSNDLHTPFRARRERLQDALRDALKAGSINSKEDIAKLIVDQANVPADAAVHPGYGAFMVAEVQKVTLEQHAKAKYAVPSICIGPGAAAPTQIKPLPIAETSDALLQGLRTLTGKPDLVLSDEDARAMLAQAIGMMGGGKK